MTDKHHGFTLIELLVAISIIGILAILVVPNVLNVYEKANKEAFKTSVKSISKSIDNYVFEKDNFPEGGINVSDLNITNKESYSGKFIKNENGNIEAEMVSNGRYCASGEIENLSVEKDCTELDPTSPTNVAIIISEQSSSSVRVIGSAIDNESNIVKYEFKIDSGNYIDKGDTNIHTFTGLTTGSHTIYLRVTNGKGLTSETSIDVNLTTLVAPTYSVSPTGWSGSKTVTITYPARETGFIYSYSIDNGDTWTEVPTGTTVDVVFNTNGTVIGKVYDGTNTITSTQSISQIDTTEAIVSLSEQSKTTSSVAVLASATDTESGITKYEFKIDSGNYIDKGNTNTHSFTGLTSGNHTVYVRVTNGAGVVKEVTLSVSLTALVAPTYSVTPSGWSTSKTVTITYPARQTGFVYSYSINGGSTWTEVPTGTSANVVFNTNGTLIGKVNDGANTVTSSQTISQIDNTAPVVSSVVSGSSNISYSSFTITRSGSATDDNLTANPYIYQISTDGSNWATKCTNNTTSCAVTGLNSNTTYYYRICAIDNAGNQSCVASKTATTLNGVFNYAYTGTVQSFTAPVNGKYKLETWGAEGTVYSNSGSYFPAGKGAYAKGEITLEVGVTLYVYVGGQAPFNYGGYVFINGGWNGGGGVCATCEEEDWNGNIRFSVKGPGGGATDISFVNSSVTYSNYRTVRSDASLLARVIVAGGGAGGSGSSSTAVDANFTYGYGGTLEGSYYIIGYGATQTSSGLGGGFGIGANATAHTDVFCSSAGGGGWYGGGGGVSSSNKYDSAKVNYIGGSSSFAWSSSSAANVPSGYSVATRYYLTNVEMIAGNASMPLPGGGTETGHSGSGYARITFLSAS